MPKPKKLGELFFPTPIDSEFMWDVHRHLWQEYSSLWHEIKITPSTGGIRFTVWEDIVKKQKWELDKEATDGQD